MLIDVILDRQEGCGIYHDEYRAKDLYDYLVKCGDVCNYQDVARALDGGTEKDVKRELCRYIDYEYNPEIKKYINSVQWLKDDLDFGKRYSVLYDILGGEWQDVCLHPNEFSEILESKGFNEMFRKEYQCAGTRMKLKKLVKGYLERLGYKCVPCEKIA